jgi:hypothetical protein
MQFLEEKILPKMVHGGEPGAKAREIFENYDFGNLEVLDFDGAESVIQDGTDFAESSIRFYVPPEEGEGDSVPMIFRVAFLKRSTIVTVYG